MIGSRMLFGTWRALLGVAVLLVCNAVLADPPGRAVRLTQISGAVSFSPAGEEDWVLAQPNRPLITGDRVWADNGAHAELQIGSAAARMGSATSVSLLNLDDRIVQINLAQGVLNLRVRRIYPEQSFEIDTPNLAFSIRRAGDYRLDVDPSGNTTIIRVRSGEGEAWGEGAAYTVGAGQQVSFAGEGLRDYSFDAMAAPDEFDNWSLERDRHEDSAVAARYVSPDMVGSSDLDEYGSWRAVEGYGNVWFPTQVAADWAPYRSGHWAWVDPWGWTWVDDAPWGFAPFHYGRWAQVQARWCWVPGPIAVRPVYAPALVAFVGGGGFSLALSTGAVAGIAWFPLGPGEVYRPAYTVSRNYFTNINVSNTVVNTTVINNFYNNVNVTNTVYRNRELPGAVTAVPTTAFTSAEPVGRHAVAVSPAMLAREPVSPVAAVPPSRASVLAVGAVAGAAAAVAIARHPPAAVLTRPVVAKTPPAPPPPPFAAKTALLATQPGKPLDPEKLKAMAPARSVEAAKVKVVAPAVAPQPLAKGGGGQGARPVASTPASAPAAVPRPPQGAAPQGAAPQPPRPPAAGGGAPPPSAATPQNALGKAPAPPAAAASEQGKERMKQGDRGPSGPPVQPAVNERAVRPPAAASPAPPERALGENKGAPPPMQQQGQRAPQPSPPARAAVPQGQEHAQRPPSPPPPKAAAPQVQEHAQRPPSPPPPKAAAPQVQEHAQRPPPPPPAKAPPPPPPKPAAPARTPEEKAKEKDHKEG